MGTGTRDVEEPSVLQLAVVPFGSFFWKDPPIRSGAGSKNQMVSGYRQFG